MLPLIGWMLRVITHKRATQESALPTYQPKIHNYTDTQRTWGHDYNFTPRDNGIYAQISGWSDERIRPGDFILMSARDNPCGVRYRVLKIEYCNDSSDMFFAETCFYKRTSEEQMADMLGIQGNSKSWVKVNDS